MLRRSRLVWKSSARFAPLPDLMTASGYSLVESGNRCLKATVTLQAESQARRIYLLQQAAKKRGETFELPQAAVGPQPRLATDAGAAELPLASLSATEEPSAAEATSAVAVREEQPTLLQHINFFAEHEAKEAHPEVILRATNPVYLELSAPCRCGRFLGRMQHADCALLTFILSSPGMSL